LLGRLKPKFKKSKLAIVKVEPTNFSIKTKLQRENIILGFQRLLNSLDFPIQILITTNKLNLDQFLNKAEQKTNSNQFKDYKAHLLNTIKDCGSLDRNFYIIIPEISSINIQLGVLLQQLKALNLKSYQIFDEEITQLLCSHFNDINKDSDKEIKEENYLHNLIAPSLIINKPDYLKVGEFYSRIIYTDGFPRSVEPGFLNRIITLSGNFDISIFIEPSSIETTLIQLNKELQKQRADLYGAEKNHSINPSLEIKYKDTRTVLDRLQQGKEKLFNFSFYINCKANSKEDLDLICKKVEAELNAMLIIPKIPLFRMAQGLKSTTALADNQLKIKRTISTKPLSAFFPFTSQFLDLHENGIWLGNNKNDVPVIKDIFSLPNYNGLILASSGAGKSYFTKMFIMRQLLNNTKVMVIDPQSEYINLLQAYNGQIVNFSKKSQTVINPLDLLGHDYADKRLSLLDLFNVMLGDVSEPQKAVLDKTITNAYERKGITEDPKTWNNQPPILEDLLKELEKLEKFTKGMEKETYRSLISRLKMYVTGVFSFFNRQTRINVTKSLTGFVIGDMPRQAKPVNMFLILDYVYMKMRKDKEKKLLVIDEAWSLLGRAEDSEYIFEIVKTCRKYNMGLLLITQDVGDLLMSKAASAILQNSSYKLLLRQEPAVIKQVNNTFQLSLTEKEKLLTAQPGEGLLITGNEHTELKSIASKEEHKLITTNPNEIKEEKVSIDPKEKVEIKIDENKGYFKKKDLKDEDIKFLLRKGYVLSSHVPLGGGQRQDYLLKVSSRESNVHYFLVKALEEYILQFTNKVWLYETKDADVVFQVGKKKIAIEVESGNTIQKDKKRLQNKIKLLKKYHDWFFLCADASYAYKYKEYGKVTTRKEVCEKIRKYLG